MKTGNCSRENVPCYLPFVAFEFVHSHTPVCWGLEHPSGKKSWLSLAPLNSKRWGKREAHPHGIHLVARWTRWSFLLLLHIQARKDSHKACSSLWPVLKTDEAMVLGPGAPGSLQGPRDWAGILGLDHSWHAKAESTGWSRKVTVFLCLSNVTRLQSEPAMND